MTTKTIQKINTLPETRASLALVRRYCQRHKLTQTVWDEVIHAQTNLGRIKETTEVFDNGGHLITINFCHSDFTGMRWIKLSAS